MDVPVQMKLDARHTKITKHYLNYQLCTIQYNTEPISQVPVVEWLKEQETVCHLD